MLRRNPLELLITLPFFTSSNRAARTAVRFDESLIDASVAIFLSWANRLDGLAFDEDYDQQGERD